jgi:UPF0176 protein
MNDIVNISAYRFVRIDDAEGLREQILASAQLARLKGTVLIAEEGINLFLAGHAASIAEWTTGLTADSRFAGIEFKTSYSGELPFKRLKVKVKREIIRMNRPTIRPEQSRAPAITAATLSRWLARGGDDDGRPLVMLDTRNGFEVDFGSFDGALDWRLQRFSDFPAALSDHLEALRGKAVVGYCTGGIRCEKAVLLMHELGLASAYQLEGGILRWFEQSGERAPGWHGDCFVFDERVALDSALTPSAAA